MLSHNDFKIPRAVNGGQQLLNQRVDFLKVALVEDFPRVQHPEPDENITLVNQIITK